jgi:hypothetical protein
MVTKAVSDFFAKGHGGIADQAIRFNGYPSLDKEDHTFDLTGACASMRLRRRLSDALAQSVRS